MGSGCLPNEKDRLKIIDHAEGCLENARLILIGLKHDPAYDPRAMESAVNNIRDALGCEYPNKDADSYNDGVGLLWLMEHHFS